MEYKTESNLNTQINKDEQCKWCEFLTKEESTGLWLCGNTDPLNDFILTKLDSFKDGMDCMFFKLDPNADNLDKKTII